jgi:hypothetical protein
MELLKNLEGMSADEQMTAVVELQKAAMKHLEEQKQVSIGKSAEMVIQGLKKIKSDLESRFDTLNSDIQSKVLSLKDGEQGIQGPKGDQGDRGRDGAQGKDGLPGRDGKDGLDGKDGISVQDAKIDFDGSLVITLSDGREINVGEVVPVDVAENIHKVTHSIQSGSGGDSQTVLDAIVALQATIATYGTMATQNKTSVDIEGGTIDNTVIGGTTPAAGTFTTLGVTTSINASSGSANADLNVNSKGTGVLNFFTGAGKAFSITDHPFTAGGSNVNSIRAFGGQTGYSTGFVATGSDTNIVFAQSTKGTSPLQFLTNNFAQEQMRVSHTASAVNYVQVTGAATGGNPSIQTAGSDTNRGLSISSKGTSAVGIYSSSGTYLQFQVVGLNSAVNYFQAIGTTTGFGPVLAAAGSDTNIPAIVQPKGTGALQAQQTDSTATGGNARGANAVDWQTSRSVAGQVASASYSVVGGGERNISSASYAGVFSGLANTSSNLVTVVAGGQANTASGGYSAVVGGISNTTSGFLSAAGGGKSNTSGGYFNFMGGGFTNSGTANAAVTTQSGTMNATTAVTLSGSNANIKVGQYITGTSIGDDTYVAAISGTSLTLSKVASGSSTSTLSFFTPHGVVVGGGNNQATGSYSFIGGGGNAGTSSQRNVASGDWSTVAGGVSNTSSGLYCSILGGLGNISSSYGCTSSGGVSNQATGYIATTVGGYANVANGAYSTIFGWLGSTRAITGYTGFSSSAITQSNGVSQAGLIILGAQTTNATATVLTSEPSAASTTNQVILPNNSAYYFKGSVIANVTGGGNTKGWTIEGAIKRGANAASTALVGTPTVMSGYADVGAATWTITATADTTNGGLAITFTGQASTTIRVVCKLETTEVTY